MDGDYGLSDLRFEGYRNEELAQQVDGLRSGQGAESLHNASRALIELAAALTETDHVLRLQLREIGVTWQGQAADGGVQATKDAAVYAADAATPVGESAKGVASQSGAFSHTRNCAPDSDTLRGPTELTGVDRFAGAFGHTTDHARRVQETCAAREQAVGGMNDYQSGSREALDRARTLPVPPGMGLVTRPAGTGTGVSGVGGPVPGSPGLMPGPAAGVGAPGGLGAPGLTSGGPGTSAPFTGGPGVPGTPGSPGVLPGPNSGVAPVPPLSPGAPGSTTAPGGPRVLPSPLFVAEAAALAGAGAGGAAAGAGMEKDRLERGRPGAGTAAGAEGRAAGAGAAPAKGATTLGAPPADEDRSVRNAERFGAKPGRPGGGALMQPAAGAAGGEEDGEHVRKYGIDSGDVFEDERLIAPALIGDEDDKNQAD